MKTFFSLDNDALATLKPESATKAFRNLLWCEAHRVGISPHRIIITLRTTVSDGGIDARTDAIPKLDSVIVSGASYFQIKTGRTFKPWQKSSLKKELFSSSTARPDKKNLDAGVRDCFAKRGKYVVVAFGHDLSDTEHRGSKRALVELLKACGYRKPNVDVIGQSQILGLFARYPSLTLELQGNAGSPFLTFHAWGGRDDMRPGLRLADPQKKFIKDIQRAIRGTEYQHLRIIGEPGIGKTRLVHHALSGKGLSSKVIYVPHPEDFQRSTLFNELVRGDVDYDVMLVIDECIDKERASIWGSLKGKKGVKLITIDHGPERTSDSEMVVLECPKLPEDKIRDIILAYLPQPADVSNWAESCDGIPRVAHAVGENLKRNPDDLLKSPSNVPMWERFIAGYENLESKNARDSLIVLRHLALFTRFGFEDPVTDEAQYIAALIEKVDPTITWARFHEVAQNLRERRILQGKRTLFIVPKMLHIYLWVDYWRVYGRPFDFGIFFKSVPSQLQHWFLQLFIYAHASPVAQEVVSKILSTTDGPFTSREFLLSEDGTKFLNHLAEADADKTMTLLEATFGTWKLDELKKWDDGRQNVVWALEKIAVWRDLFPRAAKLLTKLALAENANYSNNSTGTLLGLFVIGLGWAATQATPPERFKIIADCLDHPDFRQLGLQMCEKWFTTYGAVRTVGAEHQGLRPELEFWRPKIWGELFDAYRLVWRHLYDVSRRWSKGDRKLANDSLIRSASDLFRVANMVDEVIDTLFLIADDDATDLQALTHFVIHQQRFPGKKPKGVSTRLRKLDIKITGHSFWSRLSRYVLNTTWDEDYQERKGDLKESKLPARRVNELLSEAVADESILFDHLPKLVTADGHRLIQFAAGLAEQYRSSRFIDALIKEQRSVLPSRSAPFLSGYMGGLANHDLPTWEATILSLFGDAQGREVAVLALRFSPLTNAVLKKLLELYRAKQVDANVFSRIPWAIKKDETEVSRDLVEQVLAALVETGNGEELQIAVELAVHYFFDKNNPRSCSEDLLWKLIASKYFHQRGPSTMSRHYWEVVSKGFRKRFPARDIALLNMILEQMDSSHDDASKLARDIAKEYPREAWTIVSKTLGSKVDNEYWIREWLGHRVSFDEDKAPGVIVHFDPEQIMSWAQRGNDRQVRALLECLPKTLDADQGGRLTSVFIDTFGDDERITQSLISHFWLGGWSGPRSAYLNRKRERARQWLAAGTSGKVTAWLYKYIDRLGKMIVEAEIEEERRF